MGILKKKKEETSPFIQKQKIPEQLEEYFKEYIETGNYKNLINNAREYIQRDDSDSPLVIHNLEFEKERIDIIIQGRNIRNEQLVISVCAVFLSSFIGLALSIINEEKTTVYNIVTAVAFCISIIFLFIILSNFFEIFNDIDNSKLKNKERIKFLDFCIKEYTNK